MPPEACSLVFMGTPDLAACILARLLTWPGGRVRAVYTQPDRPAGRGYALKAPPVKQLAERHGIEVRQPLTLKGPDEVEYLRALAPDYLLVAAYGLILPLAVLQVPRRFPLNVHTSLLPLYRGAAPIQRAIMDGQHETGVSIMVMEQGLDTGPVLMQRARAITDSDTAGTMHDALAALGAELLVETLEALEKGSVQPPMPQDDARASHAPKLNKADGYIDFSLPCGHIHARVRGVLPWPGAAFALQRKGDAPVLVSVPQPGVPCVEAHSAAPGQVLGLRPQGLAIACADGVYCLPQVKPAGGKAMDAAAFANGYLKDAHGARACSPGVQSVLP